MTDFFEKPFFKKRIIQISNKTCSYRNQGFVAIRISLNWNANKASLQYVYTMYHRLELSFETRSYYT